MQQISKIEQKLKENDLDELDNSLDRVADEAKYLQPYEIVVRKSTSQSEVTSEQSS